MGWKHDTTPLFSCFVPPKLFVFDSLPSVFNVEGVSPINDYLQFWVFSSLVLQQCVVLIIFMLVLT